MFQGKEIVSIDKWRHILGVAFGIPATEALTIVVDGICEPNISDAFDVGLEDTLSIGKLEVLLIVKLDVLIGKSDIVEESEDDGANMDIGGSELVRLFECFMLFVMLTLFVLNET